MLYNVLYRSNEQRTFLNIAMKSLVDQSVLFLKRIGLVHLRVHRIRLTSVWRYYYCLTLSRPLLPIGNMHFEERFMVLRVEQY